MPSLAELAERLKKIKEEEDSAARKATEETFHVEAEKKAVEERRFREMQELKWRVERAFKPILQVVNEAYLNGRGRITLDLVSGKGEDFYKQSWASIVLAWNNSPRSHPGLDDNSLGVTLNFDGSLGIHGGYDTLNHRPDSYEINDTLNQPDWEELANKIIINIFKDKSYEIPEPPTPDWH